MPTNSALADYLSLVSEPSDLMKPPPNVPSIDERPDWHWSDVADDALDQALERWAWGLAPFGRSVVVRAAAAMLEQMLPTWDAAAKEPGPGIEPCLENIESGFDPSPKELYDEMRVWLDNPSKKSASRLMKKTRGDRLDLFEAIGNEEFRELWDDDAWMFVLTGAYAAAMTVYDEETGALERAIAKVAVSCRLTLAPTTKQNAGITTWRAVVAALRSGGDPSR